MIKNFEPRLYQQTICATAVMKNTLVVLPTGMGKTNIFLMLAAQRLRQYPNSKILFIGPTKPLIDQYREVFSRYFTAPESSMAVFTGMVSPKMREELWKTSTIIFSTPQGLENDIISGRIQLEDVSLLGIDEAHRAVGDYSYVFVARQYKRKARFARIIALTASPGSDMEKISEVCKNLFVEAIEVRTDNDPDVRPYVKDVMVEWKKVELPPAFLEVQGFLKNFISDRLNRLKSWGVIHRTDVNFISKTDLIGLSAQLRGRASQGEKDITLWNSISVLAEVLKIQHALELIETQGVASLAAYLERIDMEAYTTKVKAIKNIVKDLNFRSALLRARSMEKEGIEHPKLIELQKIISFRFRENAGQKIIVFNQYRDNALDIERKLSKIENVKAKLFVGQAKKGETGYTQKQQKEIIEQFRSGEINVLVATSIGEEGLDIPRVDSVIFFEPIPSAIRSIQRRGRTGRQEKGSVIVLLANGTRDEGYKWSAHHKEKRMHRNLDLLRNMHLSPIKQPESDAELTKFVTEEEKYKIFIDFREKNSAIVKGLIDAGIAVKLDKIENADYVLSSRVGVEYKTVSDFVDSIIDGRLLQQVKDIKAGFERPLIVIEGTDDIFSARNIHANAVRGMLSTITVSYGIPIIWTKNPRETAAQLAVIAQREQDETGRNFTLHAKKRSFSNRELQEYIVSSLPGVGTTLAKPILKEFRTIRAIANASAKDIEKAEKIGEKRAKAIFDIMNYEYAER